ncbi:MAG: tRNA pseudouridine(38-40) synthase TruA [Thermodesulfobacteriota bacterium]
MRYRAVVAYDGTAYVGWQAQREGRTLQQTIEKALSTVLREPVRVSAAGRTDAGVHARGQVIAFDATLDLADVAEPGSSDGRSPLERVWRSVNAVLPDDVVLRTLERASADFDPRRDAVQRAYLYRIWNAEVRSPFELRTAWHVREPLDVAAMAEAAGALLGEHDFASFQGADDVPRASVRNVSRSEVARDGEIVRYAIEANSFARHMVRNVVGQLVEIGRGRKPVASMRELLDARDRRLAAAPAPPHGLSLECVRYP